MEQETYQPLEYKDEVFQNLREDMDERYFIPIHYEPTLADWAVIKNMAEHALEQQKRLQDGEGVINAQIEELATQEAEIGFSEMIGQMGKKLGQLGLLSTQRFHSLASEVFARFALHRTGCQFYEYTDYQDQTTHEHKKSGRTDVKLCTKEEWLEHWGNLLNNAEFQHERKDHD